MENRVVKKQQFNAVKFKIKRNTNKLLSAQEHCLSDGAKAFRKIAHKMNVGDSIEVNDSQRHVIFNYLRYRKLIDCFKSRVVSKKQDIIAVYCIRKVTKSQLL